MTIKDAYKSLDAAYRSLEKFISGEGETIKKKGVFTPKEGTTFAWIETESGKRATIKLEECK